jgi:hypothetical protein
MARKRWALVDVAVERGFSCAESLCRQWLVRLFGRMTPPWLGADSQPNSRPITSPELKTGWHKESAGTRSLTGLG